jgi:hypothetical protein
MMWVMMRLMMSSMKKVGRIGNKRLAEGTDAR